MLGVEPKVVITREDVVHAKPDPDLFLAAADRLGVDITNSIVFGDSVWDLLAARRARARSRDVIWAKAEGCETIDWGGSGTGYPPCPADPGYGVYRFKRSFGCALSRGPGYYDLVFKPRLYHAWRLTERHVLPLAWRLRGQFNGRTRHLALNERNARN